MSKEAMRLALEALDIVNPKEFAQADPNGKIDKAITALREALAKPQEKYIYGTPLLDAMTGKVNEALDKKAENARELGLDYEPVWNNLPSNKDVEDEMRLKRLSQLAEQPAQHPKTKQISECLAVLRPTVKGKFPHEQALEELVGYITAPQPAQQEPVAWVCNGTNGHHDIDFFEEDVDSISVGTQLYTSPPAQRTWVGLTTEQIEVIGKPYEEKDRSMQAWGLFACAIEEELRRKNT